MITKESNMQLPPSKQLSNLVKHYLYVESQTTSIKTFRLFTDGNTGMVFSFRNRLIAKINTLNATDELPDAFIYGQINTFKNLFSVDKTSLLIVVFHPHGLNQLLGIPAHELMDEIIDLRSLYGAEGSIVMDRLSGCNNIPERIQLIEAFLIRLSKNHIARSQQIVLSSIHRIVTCGGLMTVNQLAHYTGYTSKSIERKFLEIVGLPPKRFANTIKQNIYLKGLRDGPKDKLTDLAFKVGYYDHSHAFKEFKKNTGVTPVQYVGNLKALALNLLEFPTDAPGLQANKE